MANEDDWRGTKSVTEMLSQLCLTNEMADIAFIFPNHMKLPAHKFLLCMRSAVFNAMFNGPLSKGENEVKIDDCSPDSFRIFLKFLYTDTVDLCSKSASGCLYLAEKYCVLRLVEECSYYLKTSIGKETVCTIYEQATLYSLQELQANCLTYMLDHARQVFMSNDFLLLSGKALKVFIGHDKLSCDEIEVFKAAIKWAKHQCEVQQTDDTTANIRKYLGTTFYLIRYPLIPMDSLAKIVSPTGLLTNEEQLQLFKYSAVVDTALDKEFNREPRRGTLIEVMFEKQQQKKYHPVNTGTISLTVETQGTITLHALRGNVLQNAATVLIKWFANKNGQNGAGNTKPERKVEVETWQVKDGELAFDQKIVVDNSTCHIDIDLLPNHLLSNIGNYSQACVIDETNVDVTYSNYQSGFLESIVFARS